MQVDTSEFKWTQIDSIEYMDVGVFECMWMQVQLIWLISFECEWMQVGPSECEEMQVNLYMYLA